MKRKRIILVCIILFPSLLYFIFELTQANFKKMAYYGPKKVTTKGDTLYYSIPNIHFITHLHVSTLENTDGSNSQPSYRDQSDNIILDTLTYPVYVILFLNDSLKQDGYKLKALYDYIQYKAKDLKNVPVFFVSDYERAKNIHAPTSHELHGDFDSLKINLPDFHSLLTYDRLDKNAYFKNKPDYVFDYFAVLVDKHRHIRGYYDPNQNSEVKRLIQEYKHLKTKDEYANTLQKNELQKK